MWKARMWEARVCDLAGQAGVRDAQGEMVSGVLDRNGSVVVVDEGEDVDRLVLVRLKCVAEQAPKGVGEFVLFGNKTQSLGYAIVNDVVPVAGKGLEVCEQVVNEMVQRDLDPVWRGFEG